MSEFLENILAHKRGEVAELKAGRPLAAVERAAEFAPPPRDFCAALLDGSKPAPRVIAEVKRRSPSRGVLRPDLDPVRLALAYEANGAAAISVLADNHFFGGSLADLSAARADVSIPVLCKEFIIDPYQIYEAREAGADAVLLIAAALGGAQLREYRELAARLGMASLVEVHNEAELDAAVQSGASIIGINNRDLHTFEVSLEVTGRILPLIPADTVTVSESGIHSVEDRQRMAALGVDALLVGESLITAPDTAAATRLICGLTATVEMLAEARKM